MLILSLWSILWLSLPLVFLGLSLFLFFDLLGTQVFKKRVLAQARALWQEELPARQAQAIPAALSAYQVFTRTQNEVTGARLRMRVKGASRRLGRKHWRPFEGKAFFAPLQPLMVWYADWTWELFVSIKGQGQLWPAQSEVAYRLFSILPISGPKITTLNAMLGLAATAWQPWLWPYLAGKWEAGSGNDATFVSPEGLCTHFVFEKTGAIDSLENGELRIEYSDYRPFGEQQFPFLLHVFVKRADGSWFLQAQVEVTDLVWDGEFAWW
jgi:hypothetical protein